MFDTVMQFQSERKWAAKKNAKKYPAGPGGLFLQQIIKPARQRGAGRF